MEKARRGPALHSTSTCGRAGGRLLGGTESEPSTPVIGVGACGWGIQAGAGEGKGEGDKRVCEARVGRVKGKGWW